MIKKIKNFFPLFILMLFGLIPLLWFKPGYIASGHDMGYSLDPIGRLISRLTVWSESFDLGSDMSWSIGNIPLYIPEAILQLMGFSIQTEQKLVFMFWFVMPGISMFILLKTLSKYISVKEKYKTIFVLLGSVFYILNHYLLHSWFVATKPEISFMIITPIVLSFLIKILFETGKPFFYGLMVALLMIFFNGGGGTAAPLYGGLLVVLVWYFIFLIILKKTKILDVSFKQIFKFFLTWAISFLFLNFYWISPLIYFIQNNYTTHFQLVGGLSGITNWIFEVSKYATFSNILRLQGFSSWYNNENHPFSNTYLENPLFVIISFSILFLFALSLYVSVKLNLKTKLIIVYFFGLGLMAAFLMSGTRTPLGFIYEFFVRYIPGFSIFRSPFYKFGYVIWTSYAVLIAFSLVVIIQKLSWITFLKQRINYLLTVIFILTIAGYSFPFFNASFFNWNYPISTMVKPPSYVFEFQKWIKENGQVNRILLYPPMSDDYNADIYSWNYWSLTPFPNLLSEKYIISNQNLSNKDLSPMIGQLYDAIEEGKKEKTLRLAEISQVDFILFRRDAKSNVSWMKTKPIKDYEIIIDKSPWLIAYKQFGEWSLYKIDFGNIRREVVAVKTKVKEINNQEIFGTIISDLSNNEIALTERNIINSALYNGSIVSSRCINCDFKRQLKKGSSEIYSRISPSSVFYGLILLKENFKLSQAKNNQEKIMLFSEFALKRFLEVEAMSENEQSDKTNTLISKNLNKMNDLLEKILTLELTEFTKNPINPDMREYTKIYLSEIAVRVDALVYDQVLTFEQERELQKIIKTLEKIDNEIAKNTRETRNENLLKYIIPIRNPGEYRMYVSPEKNSDYEKTFQENFLKSEIEIDGVSNLAAKDFTDQKYYYGSIFLKEGDYRITLKTPPHKNLLAPLSRIEIPSHGDFFSMEIPSVRTNRQYILSYNFNSKSTRRVSTLIVGEIENGQQVLISTQELKSSSDQKKIIFSIPTSTRRVLLKVKYEKKEAKEFPIILENLFLLEIVSPIIISDSKATSKIADDSSMIEYHKINSTFYTARIDKINTHFYLLFKEAFNTQWDVYFVDDTIKCKDLLCEITAQIKTVVFGQKLAESSHYKANGFTNAWYIQKPDLTKNSLAIIFFPQVVLYLSVLISLLSLGIILILLTRIIFLVRNKKEKNE